MDSVIHIKATFEGDVRRFQCRPSFEILESSLRSLFACKPEDQIVITYLDDENEYCRISCQIELDYAVTLPSPLRLVMKLVSPKPGPTQAPVEPAPANEALKARLAAINSKLDSTDLPPHKREKLVRRKEMLSAKLDGKALSPAGCPNRARVLEERLAMINSALEQANLPPHKLECLSRRKEVITAKLNHLGRPSAPCSPPSVHCPPTDANPRCHERLQARLSKINAKLARPDLPPQKLEHLTRKKSWIEAKLADPHSVKPADRTTFWQNRLNHINSVLEQPDLPPQKRERLTLKKERLTAKLANPAGGDKTQFFQMRLKHINDALAHPDLPPQRREKLTQKKKMLEEKLAHNTQETPNAWSRPHNFWGHPHHERPHGFGPSGMHPHHGPHGFGHPGMTPSHHGFGCPPHGPNSPGPHHEHPPHHGTHGFGPHEMHPHHGPHGFGAHPGMIPPSHGSFGCRGGHPGGWGRTGHLEEKLAWINQTLEQPGLPPHKVNALTQRKAMIEAKIAAKGAQNSEKGELVALRSAVGAAKVNLKTARQSGLKDEQLAPFIDAVATAKANLVKRRLELKSAAPSSF